MRYVRFNPLRIRSLFLIAGLFLSFILLLPTMNRSIVQAADITAPVTTINLTGTKDGDNYSSAVTMTLSATDAGGEVRYTFYTDVDTGIETLYTKEVEFTKSKTYTIKYHSVDSAWNTETEKEKSFTIVLPTPTFTPSPTSVPATNTPTLSPTPTNQPVNNDTAAASPTETPTPTPDDAVTEDSPTPIPTESIDPELLENTMIGPQVPRQMMQQQSQQGQPGQVKSSFDEGGPDNILDSKPKGGSSGVIKVFVTVIALTTAGVVGWIAIQSNKPMEIEKESEETERPIE